MRDQVSLVVLNSSKCGVMKESEAAQLHGLGAFRDSCFDYAAVRYAARMWRCEFQMNRLEMIPRRNTGSSALTL